ncbi:MAG: DUF975 family protein [Suipraeoptans sp.]
MEARRYYDTKSEKVLFGFRLKRTLKIGFVMLRTVIYEFLWTLTIVGFFIKRYSYKMVPFIIAENPEIDGKTAIKLSRQMMNGYKWKTFVLELSFIGWNILSGLTFGLVSVFYLNPYQTATYSEVYMLLRKKAKENNMPLIEYLNDNSLDIDEAVTDVYPNEKFSIQAAPSRKWLSVDFRKNYSIQHLILIFFTFAFVGWLWEVSIHLISDGTFVNSGVLFGPWLPIYGAGSVFVLILLKPFREKRALTFILSMLVCGIVEYISSWYLEATHGMKWWDYSGYLLNINGRVCLEGLLFFALGCYAIIYIVAPLIDNLLSKIPTRIAWVIAAILLLLFAADLIHSISHPNTGKGVTDYQSYNITTTYIS